MNIIEMVKLIREHTGCSLQVSKGLADIIIEKLGGLENKDDLKIEIEAKNYQIESLLKQRNEITIERDTYKRALFFAIK